MNKIMKIGLSAQDKQDMAEDILKKVAGGSPKGVYNTLEDLTKDFPKGNDGVYLVKNDWYFWNGSDWTYGGVYQAYDTSHLTIIEADQRFSEERQAREEADNSLRLSIGELFTTRGGIELTQAEYDALGDEEKYNGLTYYVRNVSTNETKVFKNGNEYGVSRLELNNKVDDAIAQSRLTIVNQDLSNYEKVDIKLSTIGDANMYLDNSGTPQRLSLTDLVNYVDINSTKIQTVNQQPADMKNGDYIFLKK